MSRLKRRPLRGSVTQNTTSERPTMRMRADGMTSRGFILRLSLLLGGVLLFLIFVMWSWHNGWPRRTINGFGAAVLNLSQDMHLTVLIIATVGCEQTAKDDLNAALNVKPGTPIFGFSPEAAQARIAKLPWVAEAIVERHLPDTVLVKLTERLPMARWQHDNHTVVIDTEGKLLANIAPENFAKLPLVVGAGADKAAQELITALRANPVISQNVTAASRVGDRRWDLYLITKTIVRMPEGNMAEALRTLTTLINEKKLLERDLVSVDLRLPDRLILEPNSTAQPHPNGASRP